MKERRPKNNKVRFSFTFTCSSTKTKHTIRVFKNGSIDFHEHTENQVPLSILAQEFEMSDKSHISCQAFAAAMLSAEDTDVYDNPLNKALGPVNAGDLREVAIEAVMKRTERTLRRQYIDPFNKSIRLRSLSGNVISARAYDVLETCTYRTTTTYQHSVVLTSVLYGKTAFNGKGSSLTRATKKNGKNCFIKRHSVITVALNLARWSRALRLCGGYVDEYSGGNNLRHFIYEVFKVKSENELYVHIMKQAAGYKLRSAKAVIRRGHDGVWRIHDWPKRWP